MNVFSWVLVCVTYTVVVAVHCSHPVRYAQDGHDLMEEGQEDTPQGVARGLQLDSPDNRKRAKGHKRGRHSKSKNPRYGRVNYDKLERAQRQAKRQSGRGGDDEDEEFTMKIGQLVLPKGAEGTRVGVPDESVEREEDTQVDNTTRIFYSSCSNDTCGWTLEEMKQQRIEIIKRQLLSKLRLSNPPNISVNINSLPRIPALDHIGEKEMGRDDPYEGEDYYSTTEKVIMFGERPPDELRLDAAQGGDFISIDNCIYFNLNDHDIQSAKIASAEFSVYLRKRNSPSTRTKLLIYLIRRMQNGNLRKKIIKDKDIVMSRNDTGRWYTFSFKTSAFVQRWANNHDQNMGLEIQAQDEEGNPLAIIQPINDEERNFKPYMEVQIEDHPNARSKRMLINSHIDCEEQTTVSHCCRYDLRIDFDQIGWDWILQPRSYEAFFCAGDCPYSVMLGHTHSHLSQITPQQKHYPKERRPGNLCCTPIRMSKMSMVYLDEKLNIKFGLLKGMVVDRCGCA